MTILRFSAFSLPLAVSIISLGFTNPAFAAKPDCDTDPSHPTCDDDGGADGITYTAELRGAFVFGPFSVDLEGQDERLRNGDPVNIFSPITGSELTTWNLVFNVCGLLDPVPEFTAPGGKKGWRISRPGGVYVLFRNVGPLPSASLGEDLEISLKLSGDCSYSSEGNTACDSFPPVPGEDNGHGDGISEIPLTHFDIHAKGEKNILHSLDICHSESDDLEDYSTLVITATAP